MMKITVLAILGACFTVLLKEQKAVLGVILGLITACAVMTMTLSYLLELTDFAKRLFSVAEGQGGHFASFFKIMGITCLSRIGSDLCKDAGLGAASFAVTTAGKLICICLCLPALEDVFDMLSAILSAV